MKREDMTHIAALRRQDKINRLSATQRFRVAAGRVEMFKAGYQAIDINTFAAAAAAAEAHERHAHPQIGDKDERGIFLGVWTPVDRNGDSLRMTFNVFAAPENLSNTLEYERAVSCVANKRKWHGYDGENFANDEALYAALRNGTYKGGWFIPPSDLLYGKSVDDHDTMPDNLQAHHKTGAFAGTFDTPHWDDGDGEFYWSSTESRDYADRVYMVRMDSGYKSPYLKDCRFSCRPVRLERVP